VTDDRGVTPEGGIASDDLRDRAVSHPVSDVTARYQGMKWDVVTETVTLSDGQQVRRDVVVHPGAVGVVALDDEDRVLLIRQYRHPVGRELWELPAGLLDEVGEDAVVAAQRELAEEAYLTADRWDVLIDVFSSPGMSGEAYRIYLARDVAAVPVGQRHARREEEASLVERWVPLADAVSAVMSGGVHNAMAVVGILAASRARDVGWQTLRPADLEWPQRPDRWRPRD
jgi:8-oxo-dGDP phosphatase